MEEFRQWRGGHLTLFILTGRAPFNILLEYQVMKILFPIKLSLQHSQSSQQPWAAPYSHYALLFTWLSNCFNFRHFLTPWTTAQLGHAFFLDSLTSWPSPGFPTIRKSRYVGLFLLLDCQEVPWQSHNHSKLFDHTVNPQQALLIQHWLLSQLWPIESFSYPIKPLIIFL